MKQHDELPLKLTPPEEAIIQDCRKIVKDFATLESLHPDDTPQVINHIYAIQKIVMGRVAQRAMAGLFPRDGWNYK